MAKHDITTGNENIDNNYLVSNNIGSTCDISATSGFFYGHYMRKLLKCNDSDRILLKSLRQIAINIVRLINDFTVGVHHHKTKKTPLPLRENRFVLVIDPPSYDFAKFSACPAHFGLFPGEELMQGKGEQQQKEHGPRIRTHLKVKQKNDSHNFHRRHWKHIVGPVRVVYPIDVCQPIMQVI
ncbi:unnamed protein product [Schistosoma rodhaini]|uniref:Uncharacterized protein n=1 Tax=Schistosoma rodhaini TaxID=6188 RepID=A0AA85FAH7_9TREM|nr:unnamed protein product [Schistosoma rodhaini]CAH8494247.1 unnamed protein product [Schistosoma rodhaini]